MNTYPYYAILVINSKAYSIRKVVNEGLHVPVDGIAHKTIDEAKAKCKELTGQEPLKIGGSYEII